MELLADKVDIAEAASLPEMLSHADSGADLVVMDLQMPGMQGARSLADVRSAFPETPIAVVSGVTDPAVIRAVMQFGANGYIPKTSRGKSLVNALKMVLDGETYLPPSLLDDSVLANTPPSPPAVSVMEAAAAEAGGFEKLSAREASVLRLLISGKANKEIARELDLQDVTVKVHLRNVYRKIGATSRTDAVRIAMSRGWT